MHAAVDGSSSLPSTRIGVSTRTASTVARPWSSCAMVSGSVGGAGPAGMARGRPRRTCWAAVTLRSRDEHDDGGRDHRLLYTCMHHRLPNCREEKGLRGASATTMATRYRGNGMNDSFPRTAKVLLMLHPEHDEGRRPSGQRYPAAMKMSEYIHTSNSIDDYVHVSKKRQNVSGHLG